MSMICRFLSVVLLCTMASFSWGQLVDVDFNDLLPGDLAGQGGGSGWLGGSTFTSTNDSRLIEVVPGDLSAPLSTNYAISQSGTGQHALGTAGAVAYYRDLATATGADDDIWFSFIAQLGDLDANGDSSGRTGITIDTSASNVGRFLMRGISGGNMEIFREGGSVDYPLDSNPFLVVGRLELDSAGADTISWWYNPDVTTLDATFPDDSFSGLDWDGGDGISQLGLSIYGGDEGRLDAFRFSNGGTAYADVTGVTQPPQTPVFVWAVDGGGNTSVGANWEGGSAPTANSIVTFGNAITADATVSVDAPLSVQQVRFATGNGSYDIAGPETLTLTPDATVNVTGAHTISATVAGTSGLIKTGGGDLFLNGANTYSGVTDIRAGFIRILNPASINDTVSAAGGAGLVFQGILDEEGEPTGTGFSGTFTPDVLGEGQIAVSDTLLDEVVVFDDAKSWTGIMNINGGNLEITHPNALGTGGAVTESRTNVNSTSANGGQLQLSNNITVADELLRLHGRDADSPKSHLLNKSGNNTWSSSVELTASSGQTITIDAAAGNLDITSPIVEADTGNLESQDLTLRLAGSGTGSVNSIIDVDGLQALEGNINLEKTGSGTWTIATASADASLYHQGTTNVKEGTLVVNASGDDGELRSTNIQIDGGATFDASGFGLYNLQVGQELGGAGTFDGNLGTFNDNVLAPGDNGPGTLTVNGSFTYGTFPVGEPGAIRVELGNATTVGGGVNDLIDVNGSVALNGNDQGIVNVTPVGGTLQAGTYSIIRGTSVTGDAAARLTPQFVGFDNTLLTTRQSLSVSNTATTVDVTVTGDAANLVWHGNTNSAWDRNTTANWDNGGASDVFLDVDRVTFDDSSAVTSVVVAEDVFPAQVDLNQSGTVSFTGAAAIHTLGALNANSGTTVLANAQNSGRVAQIASGATVQAGSAAGQLETQFTGHIVGHIGFRASNRGPRF